jgi:hypothetical protein
VYSKYLKDGIDPVEHREARTSQFTGVHWDKTKLKWRAVCRGTTLGHHATEEDAARAYNKYLTDGIDPIERRDATNTSQFAGVCWNANARKWQADYKKTYLGLHTTEKGAARAYSKYLKDGYVVKPAKRAGWGSSQIKGVFWDNNSSKWMAKCQGTYLGLHTTEEAAAHAHSKYLEDGSVPVPEPAERGGWGAPQFTGVSWNKDTNKWKVRCKGTYLGLHATEHAAAQAYNVEAQRLGRPLNIIPPTGAAGAGASTGAGPGAGVGAEPKRAAPMTPVTPPTNNKTKRAAPMAPAAPAPSKKMTL